MIMIVIVLESERKVEKRTGNTENLRGLFLGLNVRD